MNIDLIITEWCWLLAIGYRWCIRFPVVRLLFIIIKTVIMVLLELINWQLVIHTEHKAHKNMNFCSVNSQLDFAQSPLSRWKE